MAARCKQLGGAVGLLLIMALPGVIMPSWPSMGTAFNMKPRFPPRSSSALGVCQVCKYLAPGAGRAAADGGIVMTSTAGYGRTGNYFRSVNEAFARAHACKAVLTLPLEDAGGDAFVPEEATRTFDFSARPGGRAHPDCGNSSMGLGLTGNAKTFWFLPALPNATAAHAAFFAAYEPEVDGLEDCMRWYIGLCSPSYCAGREDLREKLVAHIRQGDVFPANHSSAVPHGYGQPPLSYYLRAIGALPWKEVIVVAQPTKEVNPVWTSLALLNATGVLGVPVRFQALSWREDFRTMMCAPSVVVSRSTLARVLLLGLAERYYTWGCFPVRRAGLQVYAIPIGDAGRAGPRYEPFYYHDNSPKQWVDILLHASAAPQPC